MSTTTSRRSTKSSRGSIPRWRTISQSSPSAGLTLIFAEPEAGSPLTPAVTKLSSSRRPSVGANSIREPRQSPDTLPPVFADEMVASGSGLHTRSPPESNAQHLVSSPEPTTSITSATPIIETAIPNEAQASLSATLEPPPASSSSWFGSLGRAKGKERAAQLNGNPIDAIAAPPPADTLFTASPEASTAEPATTIATATVTASIPDTPMTTHTEPIMPSASPPQNIPVVSRYSPQKRRSWFSTASAPYARPNASPLSSSPVYTNSSIPSSIDEEVPIHMPTETVEEIEASPGVVESPRSDATVRGRLNSLNPSSPRFTLSIPLLGRAKMPLEQVVVTARIDDAASQVDVPVDANQPPVSNHLLDVTDGQLPAAATETQEHQHPTRDDAASTASWWSYVGWNGTAPIDPSSASDLSTTHSDIPAQIPDVIPPTPPDHMSVAEDVPTNDPRTASLLSAETRQSQASGSAWYSPWAWYGSSAPPSATPSIPAVEDIEPAAKTESEMVKEEALARDQTVPAIVPAPSGSPSQLTPEASTDNPIEATITSNRAGWASFFSSRSLINTVAPTKMITGFNESSDDVTRDENGVEIMTIEDNEDIPAEASVTSQGKPKGEPEGKSKAGIVAGLSLALKSNDKLPSSSAKTPSPTKKEAENSKDTDKDKPSAPPLTISDSVKKTVQKSNAQKRKASTSATPPKGIPSSPTPPPPNLVLPAWSDTFHTRPRSTPPRGPSTRFSKTLRFVSGVLFPGPEEALAQSKANSKLKAREREYQDFGKELPRAFDVFQDKLPVDVLRGAKTVVVIGIHGWFPGAIMRNLLGEPTGTSGKFVSMMVQALEEFQEEHEVKLEKITAIPLEGEGTIEKRVEKLYASLLENQQWVDDLHAADVVFVATHSQGSVVSTHLLDRLIRDQHLRVSLAALGSSVPGPAVTVAPQQPVQRQRVCCLALCGIHLGPLRYLSSSSVLQPYIQYFESAAARELFDFQNTESEVSKEYVKALRNVLDHEVKMVYVASLNDQVVPIYSGLFTAVSHPLILRALYIDGDAYHSSDFLSNLLVLLLRVLNTGLSDSGLLAHLSEATAGSLNGVGHSTAYEELATYKLAVKYLFLVNEGSPSDSEFRLDHFNANTEQNDYEIPWSLRDLIADERVAHFFFEEIGQLRDAFREWHPKTTVLRDIKRKLQPIQKLPSSASSRTGSKLSTSSTSRL